jgi:hypothetical protein
MRKFLFLPAALLIIGLGACRPSNLGGKEYVTYIENEDNGLNTSKQIEGLEYHLQYCPQEYLLMKEYKTYGLSQKLIDLKKKEAGSLLYFKLRIKDSKGQGDVLNYNIGSNDAYYRRIEFLSYGFEESIALVSSKDTLYPALYHFERTYGVAPYADFLIAFNSEDFLNEDLAVLINDRVFDNGLIKFNYKREDLAQLPTLKAD